MPLWGTQAALIPRPYSVPKRAKSSHSDRGHRTTQFDPLEMFHIAASTVMTGRSGQMRQAAEAAVRPDEQHDSAPRRDQLRFNRLRGRDTRLPLRKMPEEVILASR
jgi:hypothetical protein